MIINTYDQIIVLNFFYNIIWHHYGKICHLLAFGFKGSSIRHYIYDIVSVLFLVIVIIIVIIIPPGFEPILFVFGLLYGMTSTYLLQPSKKKSSKNEDLEIQEENKLNITKI